MPSFWATEWPSSGAVVVISTASASRQASGHLAIRPRISGSRRRAHLRRTTVGLGAGFVAFGHQAADQRLPQPDELAQEDDGVAASLEHPVAVVGGLEGAAVGLQRGEREAG